MTDIKQLAMQEAEKRYPPANTPQAQRYRPAFISSFIEGAEFGFHQRWIPVTERMPKEEDCIEGWLMAWRSRTQMPELVNHFYFINRSEMYDAWMPIPKFNPPNKAG